MKKIKINLFIIIVIIAVIAASIVLIVKIRNKQENNFTPNEVNNTTIIESKYFSNGKYNGYGDLNVVYISKDINSDEIITEMDGRQLLNHQIIITFKKGTSIEDKRNVIETIGTEVISAIESTDMYGLRVKEDFKVVDFEKYKEELMSKYSCIEYTETNAISKLDLNNN